MRRRQRVFVAIAACFAVMCVATLAALVFRPSLILGVDGSALGRSLAAELPQSSWLGSCRHESNHHWRCSAIYEPDPGSGGYDVIYDVVVDRFGCWHAVRVTPSQTAAPRTEHGCIYLWEF